MEKDFSELKKKAVSLRKKGLSYGEIKEEVKVAKSTLSFWLKSIPLRPEHKKRLYTKKVQLLARGPNSQKERRKREIEAIIQIAESEVKSPLPLDTLRMMGAALYWAEGTKGGLLEFNNSDPYAILFFVKWVEKLFGISSKEMRVRLNIYPQQSEKEVKKFWSELTGIPLKNFRKTFIKPLSKNFKKNNLYYGTARVEVPKSTDLKHRIFGWVNAVFKEFDPKMKLIQKRWIRLTKVARPVNLKITPP